MKLIAASCRILVFALGIVGVTQLSAQNLVMNPSFESYTSCPQGPSQFDFAVNWHNPWTNIVSPADSCSTSDLFNSCSFGGAGVPQNLLGTQPAHTGNGYAGFILYDGFPLLIFRCDNIPTGWREYVEGTLISPLVAGQLYTVSFYVSLADNVKFATSHFGVYFSNTLVQISCGTIPANASSVLPFTPQLTYAGGVITDTSSWTKMQWCYTATGGEQYIIIGNFNNDANTTYTCVNGNAINSHAYYFIDDVEVSQTTVCCPIITFTVDTQTNVSCRGGSDGSVTISGAGGTSPYTYLWSTGATDATLSGRPAGTVNVTVTDGSGCTGEGSVIITQPATLSVAVSSSTSGCGTSATASPSGGTGPFAYLWANGATLASISNLATGTYTVTVTDSRGCTASGSASVTQSAGFTLNQSSTNTSCGVCNGTATITPVGGTAPFTYAWSNGQTAQTATALCAGNYTVTVTEGTSTGSNVFWNENFSVGVGGWTLNLASGTNQANANLWIVNNSNGCAQCPSTGSGGNYLHITCGSGVPCLGSAGDCTYDTGVPLFSNAATDKYVTSPNISTIGKTGITLKFWYMAEGEAGLDYGLVRLSNNGGAAWTDLTTHYSGTPACTQATIFIPSIYENIADFRIAFRWINDNNYDGNDPPFLIDDMELSSATGTTACTATTSVAITQPIGFTVSISSTSASCIGGDGSATAVANGGASPFTYLWSNGGTTSTISNLSPGIYSVTMRDANNCTAAASDTITQPSGFTVSVTTTAASCAGIDGSATAAANGGASSFTYLWSNGGTTSTISNLAPGNYSVTMRDANNCTATVSDTVGQPVSFTVSTSSTDANCGVSDGSATATPNGGVTPFTFIWTSGATTPTALNLAAGSYDVTVMDNNSCTATATATVGNVGGPSITFDSKTDVACFGDSTGAINISISGGTQPYSPAWSNGATTEDVSNLSAGSYTVTVTDLSGCISIFDTAISQPADSLKVTGVVTNAGCSIPTGSINVSVTGGIPTYNYNWSSGATSEDLTNIVSGNYRVTVTDRNLCIDSASFTITAPGSFSLTLTAFAASCFGETDGSVSSNVAGGNPPLLYNWSTGAHADSIGNLSSGTYVLTVTDNDLCSVSDTAIVSAPTVITTTASITTVLCRDDGEGSIKLVPSGGTPNYTVAWSNGGTSLTISELAPGRYSATVTDANGCLMDTSFNLNSSSVYDVEFTITPTSCDSAANGSAQVNIINGTTPPYTYEWSTGDTIATLKNLIPGEYFITVTDDLNCLRKDTAQVGIGGGFEIEDTITSATCPNIEDGAIAVTVIGGAEPYVYVWSNGATKPVNVNLRADTYYLTVTDHDNCIGMDTSLVWVDSTGSAECDTLVIYEVFSPNGDGRNDRWVVDGLGDFADNDLQIFNRWGNVVFEAKPYVSNWDGTSNKDELLPAATYYYVLKLNDKKQSIYSGSVTLIR